MKRIRLHLAVACAAAALGLGSTCVFFEEAPEDTPYGQESEAQATMEEQMDAVEERIER